MCLAGAITKYGYPKFKTLAAETVDLAIVEIFLLAMKSIKNWGNRFTNLAIGLVKNGVYPPLGIATASVLMVSEPSILGWLGLLVGVFLFEISLAAMLLFLGHLLSNGCSWPG